MAGPCAPHNTFVIAEAMSPPPFFSFIIARINKWYECYICVKVGNWRRKIMNLFPFFSLFVKNDITSAFDWIIIICMMIFNEIRNILFIYMCVVAYYNLVFLGHTFRSNCSACLYRTPEAVHRLAKSPSRVLLQPNDRDLLTEFRVSLFNNMFLSLLLYPFALLFFGLMINLLITLATWSTWSSDNYKWTQRNNYVLTFCWLLAAILFNSNFTRNLELRGFVMVVQNDWLAKHS